MKDRLPKIIREAARDGLNYANEEKPLWMTGYHRLTEANINSIMRHGKSGMVIISANRSEVFSQNEGSDLSKEYESWLSDTASKQTSENERKFLRLRNKKAEEGLKSDIKARGLSYTPVYGGYHGIDSVQDDLEPSYIVYAKDRNGNDVEWPDLYDFAIEMCRKYKQESVYVQAPGDAPVYVDCDGNRVSSTSTKDFKFNRDDEMFYTTTKRDKTSPQRFTADINFESFFRRGYSSYFDLMRRGKGGEFILI